MQFVYSLCWVDPAWSSSGLTRKVKLNERVSLRRSAVWAVAELHHSSQGIRDEPMNWGWIARHTAVAIGLTFVVVAVSYLAVRLALGM